MNVRLPLLLVFLFCTCVPALHAQIEWLSWEEAVERNKTEPRKMLVDVYTDWCGWCKKMDKTTFKDPLVAAYVSKHFYAVKFNAEQKTKLTFQGHDFAFDSSLGRRGAHSLAVALLDGQMSYPSIVYLNETHQRITISPGFKTADSYIKEAQFIGGGHYANQTYQEYLASKK